MDGGVPEVEQLLTIGGYKDGQVAGGVAGGRDGNDAGHDLGLAFERFDVVAQGAEAAASHGVERILGSFRDLEGPEVSTGAGPEFPFDFREDAAGVGEGGAAAGVDCAADVVWVGVGEDDGIDIPGADAGNFQAGLYGAGAAGILAGAGIDQDGMAAGFYEQAGIRA